MYISPYMYICIHCLPCNRLHKGRNSVFVHSYNLGIWNSAQRLVGVQQIKTVKGLFVTALCPPKE